MGIKIWRVTFGYNVATNDVEAKTADEAMEKARKEQKEGTKVDPEAYWISKVELLAESDD